MSKRKKKKKNRPSVPLLFDQMLAQKPSQAKVQMRTILGEEEVRKGVRDGKLDILFSIVGEKDTKQIYFVPRKNLPLEFLKDMLKKALDSVDKEYEKIQETTVQPINSDGLVKKKKIEKAKPISVINMNNEVSLPKEDTPKKDIVVVSKSEQVVKKTEVRVIFPDKK